MKRIRESIYLLLILVLSSCSHYLINDPKSIYEPDYGYRYLPRSQTIDQDKIFVALAFSGGGTRAAALSYGVMEKLNSTPIRNGSSTLLNEVDVISSVSGGSFTSAYYGLFGGHIFTDFKDKFLYRDIQGELLGKLVNPVNWFRLMSPNFNRIDLAIEHYNKTIFDKKTYKDLINSGRQPFIAINATNLTTGSQFVFTQPTFDILGSDLSTLPVARAVASSSAFPFLLSPVSYKNHPKSQGFYVNKDISNGFKDKYDGPNPRRYIWANNQYIYHADKPKHPYVHLMDGGLSDNIGVRYLADNFNRSSGFIYQRKTAIKELAVIVVNAKTQPPEHLDEKESPPNLIDVAYKTATVSMDNYSFETVQMISDLLNISSRAAREILDCQAVIDQHCSSPYQLPKMGHQFNITVVEINFLNVIDSEKRKRLLSLPTSFSLTKPQVEELISVGGELLEQSKAFNDLMARIK
ncbi:patatin-like phospholipase family protein [Desulfospira joergensenii]|uniref:patatin-like phospholipase family protein n=1 Tax=Desulfospira joergensenii TaxID=53329 RepID=UPI000683F48C|nr:patatin-like phospholipase family protein [Desulfospira joergensenii]